MKRFKKCRKCALSSMRRKVVLGDGEGEPPFDLMFIADNPGLAENATGKPFLGTSRTVLSSAVCQAARDVRVITPSYYMTYLVACMPQDAGSRKPRDPTPEEVWACQERLEAEYSYAQPKTVFVFGSDSLKHARKLFPGAGALPRLSTIVVTGMRGSPYYRKLVRELGKVLKEMILVGDKKCQRRRRRLHRIQ